MMKLQFNLMVYGIRNVLIVVVLFCLSACGKNNNVQVRESLDSIIEAFNQRYKLSYQI